MMGDSTATAVVVPWRWRGGQSNRWSGRLGISWFIDSMPTAAMINGGNAGSIGVFLSRLRCATHRPLGRRTSPRTRRLELAWRTQPGAPLLEPLEPLERPSWLTPCCT